MDRDKILKLITVCILCIGTIVGAVYLIEWLRV
jgi:hypothetical protein